MLQSNLRAIHPRIWLADFRQAEKPELARLVVANQLKWCNFPKKHLHPMEKTATIILIIHKPSTHTKLHSPTRRSGVELTTTKLDLVPFPTGF